MIDKFEGKYRWLSNFWESPIWYEAARYPSVEHAYQAAKTFDEERREKIRLAKDAKVAKRMGKSVVLRPDWDKVKIGIMRQLVASKFEDQELRDKLIETGNQELAEGNWWGDTFWGICDGEGENWLGRILMDERKKWL